LNPKVNNVKPNVVEKLADTTRCLSTYTRILHGSNLCSNL